MLQKKLRTSKLTTQWPSPGADGAEVIYALRDDSKLSNLILEQFEKNGQNTRKAYQRRLPSNTSKDYYFIHRDTGNTKPIIVEYGFLDGNGDDVSQLKNNWMALTDAVINGIVNYTNNNPQGYIMVEDMEKFIQSFPLNIRPKIRQMIDENSLKFICR